MPLAYISGMYLGSKIAFGLFWPLAGLVIFATYISAIHFWHEAIETGDVIGFPISCVMLIPMTVGVGSMIGNHDNYSILTIVRRGGILGAPMLGMYLANLISVLILSVQTLFLSQIGRAEKDTKNVVSIMRRK